MEELNLSIANISFLLKSCDNIRYSVSDNYRQFLSSGKPDIALSSQVADLGTLQYLLKDKVFDSGVWSLYRSNGNRIFCFSSLDAVPPVYKIAKINEDFTSGDIYLDSGLSKDYSSAAFEYPLDEVLMISMLSLGRGILVHSSGVKLGDSGYLFVGSSGRGKSTISKLWNEVNGAVILNDDRIVIRKEGSKFWMYGTPWHGDARICAQEKVELKKIFFIKHANENCLTKLVPIDAVSRLIVCSFAPLWDKQGMEFSLDFSGGLVESVPSFELGFLPNNSVIDFLKNDIGI